MPRHADSVFVIWAFDTLSPKTGWYYHCACRSEEAVRRSTKKYTGSQTGRYRFDVQEIYRELDRKIYRIDLGKVE